ncbi:MAG: phosphatidate cytidylyltransferase [Armatimonadetes bacterium]|nr:phosphatidate cytidylyltransferase [Armatimonadota bacterium]
MQTLIVAAPVAVALMLWPGGVPAVVATTAVLALAYGEYCQMCLSAGIPCRLWWGVLAIVLFAVSAQGRTPVDGWMPDAWLLLGALVLTLETLRRERKPVLALGASLLGVLWIGGMGSLFLTVRFSQIREATSGPLEPGAWAALGLLLTVWALDICAYLGGRAFGRIQIAPSISPKKTVEGAIVGFFAATGVGLLVAPWMGLGVWSGASLGAVIGLAGQAGDLFESAIKRELQVKDSGASLPGHGGWLDRIDSLLFACAVAAWWLARGPR